MEAMDLINSLRAKLPQAGFAASTVKLADGVLDMLQKEGAERKLPSSGSAAVG